MNPLNREPAIAQRRIDAFERQHGRLALLFACHAALPVAFNPNFIHLLRINFFMDPPEVLPPAVEASLLLSPLCQEIGDNLYEMDVTLRNLLLKQLASVYTTARLREIAQLLWEYTDQSRTSPWSDLPRLERAQKLTVVNFLDRVMANEWLVRAEQGIQQGAHDEEEWVAMMRVSLEKTVKFQDLEVVSNLILPIESVAEVINDKQVASLGFFVRSDGHLITIAGNLDGDLFVRTKRGVFACQVVANQPNNSLVLLKVTGENFPVLKLSDLTVPKLGSDVYCVTYKPHVGLSAISGQFRELAQSRADVNSQLLQIDGLPYSAFKGSPIFTSDGGFLGLISSHSNTTSSAYLLPTDFVKQFIKQSLPNPSILLVTVTDIVSQSVFDVFSQAAGHSRTREHINKITYFDLGQIGEANVYMVQAELGAAILSDTLAQTIKTLKPRAVIMVGLAFGMNPNHQNLGDILIAKQIMVYELDKIKGSSIPRSDPVVCSISLFEKFRAGTLTWQGAKVYFGSILSGEKLIADETFRDQLFKLEPESIGGEMEGIGLYGVASDAKVDWILIKAISDFADNNQNNQSQLLAAQNAANFVRHVIQSSRWEINSEAELYGISISGGIRCADFIGKDQNILYGFIPEDVERLIEKVLAMMQAGGVFQPAPDQQDALQIEYNGEKLVIHQGAISQLSNQGQERAYLLALILDQENQRWATRFVPLAGKMDMRQLIEGLPISFTEFIIPAGEAGGQATQRPLKDITEAMQSHGAFVILGEPGSGKTTIQQKIAFESALALLKGAEGRIPLFVRLSQQGERDPYSFLQVEWERRTGLPFARALAQGRILILADGINDIPRDKRNERLLTWMNFEKAHRGSNQLIFSGRARDYDNDLNLPRVLVEPLDKARIHDFLVKHKAEGLAELLDDPASSLGEMASNPLNLFVLVMVYHKGGRNLQVLANRGRLFESFAWELMSHEQILHRDGYSVDSKIELFARLAYDMQKQGSSTTFDLQSAQNALPKQVLQMGEPMLVDPAAVFRFGRGASILDPLTIPDVRFYHHLLQEYFAARELLKRFATGENLSVFWKTPRTKDEMPAAEVSEWDALPEPPVTGWEVTTIMACGLSQDAQKLIEAIRLINPALAGRCLNEAGIVTKDWGVRKRVQADLLADIYNPKLHLCTRLQAGFTLGQIGDPRFEAKEVNGVQVVLPQMVDMPAGKYFIGSVKSDQNSYEQEYPQHTVELPAFSIGKWSVTNAEFACFMNAGGYENKKYWQGNLATRWLNGEDVSGGQMKSYMELLKYFHDNPNWKTTFETSGNYSPQQIESYEYIAGLTEDELKEQLGKQLSQKSRSQPEYWKDRERNNPSQPVVGITWFEANAYCAWLSEITGKQYRLPSEVKWEAAARGAGNSRKYPWGEDWDKERTNSIEGRVMKSSPVGVYTAAGAMGPFGAEDQVGNVYEWTSSLFLPYPYNAEKSELKESNTECVVRGGAWDSPHRDARCTYRSGHPYDYFATNIGFRICVTSTESTNINPVDFRFRQFIKQIEPSRQKREEVNQIIDSLRSRLIRPSDDIYQKIELFGSFARDTSIESLFDVDLLVYFGEKLASESPKEAYDMLASTLRQIYKTKLIDPSLMRKGQIINPGLGRNDQSRINPSSFGGSLNVKLDTVNLEILPAIESKSQKGILVPDSRLIRWIPTNHLKHQEFTEKMDNATGGIYRSVVKSMKWWLYYQSPKWRILSGFAIECLIGTYFSSKPDNAINEFKLILQRIRKEHTSYLTLRTVNELGVPNGKKPTGITQKRFATFESLIDATLIVLKDIEKVNSSEKLILLGKIFGQSFSEFDGEIPQQTLLTSADFPKLGNTNEEKAPFLISNSLEVRSNQQEPPLKEQISPKNVRRTLPPGKRERPPKPELPKPVDKEVSKLEINDIIRGVVETDAGAGKKVSLILPNGGENDRAIIPAGTSSINRYKKGGKVLLEVRKIEGNSQTGFKITCHPVDL